jgi:hypothetical protein
MLAEHPITTASQQRQAEPCVTCSPCTCSSVGDGNRWRRLRSPCKCPSVDCMQTHLPVSTTLLLLSLSPPLMSQVLAVTLRFLALACELQLLCSRNACSTLSLLQGLPILLKRTELSKLPCCDPQNGLDGLPALSKKGAAVTADSPNTTVDTLIDYHAGASRHH